MKEERKREQKEDREERLQGGRKPAEVSLTNGACTMLRAP